MVEKQTRTMINDKEYTEDQLTERLSLITLMQTVRLAQHSLTRSA
jgi:hypothetical protein